MAKFVKVISVLGFIILCGIGVLFLMAAPVDASRMTSRLIIGVVLIVLSILFLALAGRAIEFSKYKFKEYKKSASSSDEAESYLPDQIICNKCGQKIQLSDYMKKQDVVYCENCGDQIKLDKDNINW